jgi:molecular chaperone GrpE
LSEAVLDEAGTEVSSPVENRDDDPGARAQGPDGTTVVDDIREELTLLRKAVEQHHERAAARERVIDQLSAELDRLRLGDRRSLLRPVLLELCRLRDDLLKQASSLPATFSAEQAQDLLSSYADSVELALETQSVLPFAPVQGERFDPRRHRRISSAPTADEAQHSTVASFERSGYTDEETERVLQPAWVVLYEYRAPEPAPDAEHAANPSTTENPAGVPAAKQATGHTTEEHP